MHGARRLSSFIKSHLNTLHKKFVTHTVKDNGRENEDCMYYLYAWCDMITI